MFIDSHAHVNFAAYKDDSEKVINRALKENIWMINVGSQYDTSKRAVMLAEKFKTGIYAAIGLHPIHLETRLVKIKIDREEIKFKTAAEEDFDYQKYKQLALSSKKVVAVGEIGLDWYWRPKTKRKLELFKQRQKEILLKQLKFAKELDLPVIFHCRMAHGDLIEILEQFQNRAKRLLGVIHCFTGTLKQAQKYMEMGFYLGFNGLIFKMDFEESIRKTPLEKILIETDCPYLTPPQVEGRNEPLYLKYIAQKIAQIKGLNYQQIAEQTTKNARSLFRI